MLAEAMAQLDHMTRGRAMFGVGPGALPSDAIMIGIPVADLRRRMEEGLDTIVALMKGETVTRKTDWFELHKARLQRRLLFPADDGDGGDVDPLARGRGRGGPAWARRS